VKLAFLLLLFSALIACSSPTPYATTVGVLKAGATLTVRVQSAAVRAYQPLAGQRRDLFTIATTALPKGTPPAAPRLSAGRLGVVVRAPDTYDSLLVRVPDRVNLVVESQHGNVNVTDINGNARVAAVDGNVDLRLPGYAQAAVGTGNVTVMMGATEWPGTLHFSTRHGDLEVWISGKAAFGVPLHTGNGVLFTDFGLRGNSNGSSETIDGSVGNNSAQRVDVETASGSIRLLRLQPQP
jgi:Putative adhesin